MNGIDRIDGIFRTGKPIKLMTHVVGGYPDMNRCRDILLTMVQKGVDLIEIQIPFSDPTADGPVIVAANHAALHSGVSTSSVLAMIEQVRKETTIPLLIMSYINPLFAYGIPAFVQKAAEIGIDGFILPDCPPEEDEFGLPALCKEHGIAFVPLIAPTTDRKRIAFLMQHSVSPFVYAVLRMGVTGRATNLDAETIAYLARIKEATNRFVAAGFGIREKAQLDALTGHADCGIVGSELLRRVRHALDTGKDPVRMVGDFIESIVG